MLAKRGINCTRPRDEGLGAVTNLRPASPRRHACCRLDADCRAWGGHPGKRVFQGQKWRWPRQPHSGTQCHRCGCSLPGLTRLTANRCGGTDRATITYPPCSERSHCSDSRPSYNPASEKQPLRLASRHFRKAERPRRKQHDRIRLCKIRHKTDALNYHQRIKAAASPQRW